MDDIFPHFVGEKNLHPQDLKAEATTCLNSMLEPIRNTLEKSKTAQQLAEEIKSFKVTR